MSSSTEQAHDLGPFFEPALRAACHDRLGNIRWFKTAWQRGGAATAYTTIEHDLGTRDAVIKFPIGPREYKLLSGLGESCSATPQIEFHGTELGSADMAWVVMERLPGEPVKTTAGAVPHKRVFQAVADAAAIFYDSTLKRWPIEKPHNPWPWDDLIAKSRQAVRDNPLQHQQQWKNALKDVARYLPRLVSVWESRQINTFCHGDLHLSNIMTRDASSTWNEHSDKSDEQLVLVDFGEVHEGHWIEDAVYLERIYWANPEVAKKVKIVPLFAKARKSLGLPCDDDYAGLAQIRRVLMASCAPAWLQREGNPQYLAAALAMIERALPHALDASERRAAPRIDESFEQVGAKS